MQPTLHLFCHVIDNFGDIGMCWRLARQLVAEYKVSVTIWVDHLDSFKRICRSIDPHLSMQVFEEVTIRRWDRDSEFMDLDEAADVVIEAFGCHLPSDYIAAMSAHHPKSIWINLEYLSAEQWVENCHEIASPHAFSPLIKHFFFPGFTSRTGGLLREKNLIEARNAFQAKQKNSHNFFANIGVLCAEDSFKVSLFGYAGAPVQELLAVMQSGDMLVECFVPEGVAHNAISAFMQQVPTPGLSITREQLTVHVIPLLSQSDYDKLLWSCDLNFVRGEDSFVRAQWAGCPFVWQIYPQEENAHRIKLNAFLERYLASMSNQASLVVRRFWNIWNGGVDTRELAESWLNLQKNMHLIRAHNQLWIQQLIPNGDLASNLMNFIAHEGLTAQLSKDSNGLD